MVQTFYYAITTLTLGLLLNFEGVFGEMTVDQLKQMGQVMQTTCLNVVKITPEQHHAVQDGKFSQEKDVKCFINCMFEKMGAMKRGKFNADFAAKQINSMFPTDMKDPSLSAITNCKNEGKGTKDPCEYSYILADCFARLYPDFFVIFKSV